MVRKMFSGEKWGRAERKARREEMKRMERDLVIGRGNGWIGRGFVSVLAVWVRYQVMILGIRRGPRVKRRVLRLVGLSVSVLYI